MQPTILKNPSIHNGAGIYNTGAEGGGGGEQVSGGLLYKGYFTSNALDDEIDPSDDYIFNDSFKFRAINTIDKAILTVDNFNYNREDDVEIKIVLSCRFTRDDYPIFGNMTSTWYHGPSGSFNKDSKGRFLTVHQPTISESDWATPVYQTKAYYDFQPNTEYEIKYKHPKNTDKLELYINNVLSASCDSPGLNVFYGNTVKFGIGGIYENINSLLYDSTKDNYIKSNSYIKINGDFLPRA